MFDKFFHVGGVAVHITSAGRGDGGVVADKVRIESNEDRSVVGWVKFVVVAEASMGDIIDEVPRDQGVIQASGAASVR